jgi:hypothetical protein
MLPFSILKTSLSLLRRMLSKCSSKNAILLPGKGSTVHFFNPVRTGVLKVFQVSNRWFMVVQLELQDIRVSLLTTGTYETLGIPTVCVSSCINKY